MQKIDIDGIIDELKKTEEWKEYLRYLEKNKKKFNNNVNYFIGKEIIKDLIEGTEIQLNNIENKWILNRYNGGTLDKIDVIKNVKNKFIEFFIKEIKFCPFCGKTSLVLFNSDLQKNNNLFKNGRLFDLDHFFPKEKYPYLAINFYNLIPICKGCNYIKNNDDPLTKARLFHPYFGYLNNLGNYKLDDDFILKGEHSKFFKLKEIYLNSQDTKNDIWFIRDKIEKIKTDKINSKKLGLTSKLNLEERKDLFFKNYYPLSEQDILKFSNGKLKKDLIGNLKI